MSLALRPVTADDGPAAKLVMADCEATFAAWLPAGWTPPPVLPEWPGGFVAPDGWAHGAFDDAGALVGFASFRPAEREGFAHVDAVFVHPSRWREGIAASLLALAEAEMRARGLTGAQLWTPAGSPAERFYAAQGWGRDGRREWHDWLGLTVVGYEKTFG